MFITSEGRVWPCCHLQDEQVSGKTDIISKINLKNDLKTNTFYDIIKSEWYEKILIESILGLKMALIYGLIYIIVIMWTCTNIQKS